MEPCQVTSSEHSESSGTERLLHSRENESIPFVQSYILDIILTVYALYIGLLTIPLTDAMMKKTCYFELKYNDTICESLSSKANDQFLNEVQRITKFYGLAMNIAGSLPAAVSTIVASNFIARFGMKAPVIVALIGSGITCLLQVYSCAHMGLPLYFNVIFQIPQAIAGGLLVIMTAVQTRIALSTAADNRKYRYFLLRYLLLISNLIAVAVGMPIYKNLGTLCLAVVLAVSLLLSLVLAIFVLRDQGVDLSESFCVHLRKSIDFTSLKEGLGCLGRKRPGHARIQVYFMLISLTIGMIPYAGTDNLEQLYLNKIYAWDAPTFASITSYSLIALTVASLVIFFLFTKVLHLTEPTLMLICFALYTGKLFSKSLMFFGTFMFWIQLALGAPLSIGTTAASAHLTRMLARTESAMIFGLNSSLERVIPLFVDIGFSAIYAASIQTFPGLVFIFEGLIFLLPVTFAMLCFHWIRKEGYPDYDLTGAEEGDETVPSTNTRRR